MANDEGFLKQCLSKYTRRDYICREVISLIQSYRGLSYRLENFVFNNGNKKELLNLDGTIPVNYKGAVYNIPICIWLMDTHPQNAPLCFVKPTADMSIKVSRYVDSNGKVYLPYLHEWSYKSSTLQMLIQSMTVAFSEIPPVYSRPRNDIRPPYPVNSCMPSSASGYPFPQAAYQNTPNFQNTPNLPYPNYGTPYPGGVATNGAPYLPQPITNNSFPQEPVGPNLDLTRGTITEEHIKASLLSAVEDKLRRRLKEQSQQSQAELETLKRTQQELREGKTRLEDILGQLQRERSELDKNINILQEKEKELKESVSKLEEQEGIDVDEAVVTTAPLYSQLLNSFAEEATLEDAIYYMGEALRKEVIDLDTFLKQVRTLARRQFTLRALMHKCRQKAQLAC